MRLRCAATDMMCKVEFKQDEGQGFIDVILTAKYANANCNCTLTDPMGDCITLSATYRVRHCSIEARSRVPSKGE